MYGTLVAPDLSDMSVIAVNTDATATAHLSFQLVGVLAQKFAAAGAFDVRISNSTSLFVPAQAVPIASDGSFAYALPPRSVVTITSLRTLSKAQPPIPPRGPFPLPYTNNFEGQRADEPGRLLSDLFGAWYVATDPLGQRGAVLRQAVSVKPAAWLGADGPPFTSLPGPGAAFANGNLSVSVLLTAADVPRPGAPAAVFLCGRVPIWQPANYHSDTAPLGVCVSLAASGAWALVDTTLGGGARTLASGTLPGVLGAWHDVALTFEDDAVGAWVDGVALVARQTGLRSSAGVYGLATLWNTASFDALVLAASNGHARTLGSFLFDVLPGEQRANNVTGWVGFVLDLTAPDSLPLLVGNLGRFRASGNAGVHALDVVDAATGASVLPGGAPLSVDLSPAGCLSTDLLGFCYAAGRVPGGGVTLAPGRVYYVVSAETAGGDTHIHMVDPAAATTHSHRDGTSMLAYMGPRYGTITGSVVKPQGAAGWTVEPNLDCMRGPLNLLVGSPSE